MDRLFQSIALVQQTIDTRTRMLLRWQTNRSQWEFIVGKRLNEESFRESVIREVAWQLNLNRKTDFLVSNMAQVSMEYVETQVDKSEQHIAVSFYNVHLYRRGVLESLADEPSNRWFSATEICRGKTADGQTIQPRIVDWINKWTVVQPWQ